MFKNQLLFLIVAVTAVIALPTTPAYANNLPLLKGVKRILFLGDSITYAGEYVDYVQAYLETHCSDQSFEIIDIGLPSETVSGLTEPGHAGGAFPRPVLSERLDRVLSKVKPDLVFACYGMNDGIYYPFAEERFEKYRSGIQSLVDKVTAAKARLILLTPPPFDAVPVKGQTLPAGLAEYRQPFEGYDEVLAKYSGWLLQQRKHGWHVIDIHTPINQYLTDQRKLHPDFHLAGDGVHINPLGHWLIANEILKFLGAAAPDLPINLDARSKKTLPGGDVIDKYSSYAVATMTASLPMPIDPALNLTVEQQNTIHLSFDQHLLRLKHSKTNCSVTVVGTEPKVFTSTQLAEGVSLIPAICTLGNSSSDALLMKVHEVRAMLTDSWLTEVGHKRPGMAKGLPIDEAVAKARKLESEIKVQAKPLELVIQVQPVA